MLSVIALGAFINNFSPTIDIDSFLKSGLLHPLRNAEGN